ncbi:Stigma-specific protein Stig1 [Corchorus capsularis]|uniref:Stigma-specific protein Stig1 n=1 Tax=Corchorus capsularis TaxID=210143 RepID=A0A1R3I2V3_COCAP|nr:Stigma-specific protein Stig1 [Corchorus capsularis]
MLALFMALVITLISATPSKEEESLVNNEDNDDGDASDSQELPTSLRGISRFLAQKPARATMTCNKYPRVCRVAGSPGPDCCKKKCVNVKTDRLNCGMCGKKCKYSEICCKGKCVNPMSHKKHCGGCNNACDKGSKCLIGMCSYA